MYSIKVSKNQLRVIMIALESYFRTRSRNESQDLFEKAFDVAAPNRYERNKTPDMVTAIDIWHVIRHQIYLEFPEPKDHYTVDAYPPTPCGEEPLPKIVKEE